MPSSAGSHLSCLHVLRLGLAETGTSGGISGGRNPVLELSPGLHMSRKQNRKQSWNWKPALHCGIEGMPRAMPVALVCYLTRK